MKIDCFKTNAIYLIDETSGSQKQRGIKLPHAHVHQDPKIEKIKPLKAFKGGVRAISFCVPVIILRITALFISLFGAKGKNCSEKIVYTSKKILSIYVIHNLFKPMQFFGPPVLCRLKNIAAKSVIRNEEDKQKFRDFVELLKNTEYLKKKQLKELTPKQISFLQSYSDQSAHSLGICWGASLFLLKKLLSNVINSEEELVNLFRPYKKGFPAEASALQSISTAFKECKLKFPINDKAMSEREINELLNLKPQGINELTVVNNKLKELVRKMKEETEESLSAELGTASLIDLTFKSKNPFIYGDAEKKETQEKLNKLDKGYYLLSFGPKYFGHAILFIKKDFGSYFVDPNTGLIRCENLDTGSELSKLVKKGFLFRFFNCSLEVHKFDNLIVP